MRRRSSIRNLLMKSLQADKKLAFILKRWYTVCIHNKIRMEVLLWEFTLILIIQNSIMQ